MRLFPFLASRSVFAAFIILSIVGYAVASAEMEVIDVRSFTKLDEGEFCTEYVIELDVGEKGRSTTQERCFTSGPSENGRYVMIMAPDGSRTRGVYRVHDEFGEDGNVIQVVHVSTWEIPFNVDEYLRIEIADLDELESMGICVTSGMGVLPIETFKKNVVARMSQARRHERSIELEIRIKSLQPLCNP